MSVVQRVSYLPIYDKCFIENKPSEKKSTY
jgi:hypothetical protein